MLKIRWLESEFPVTFENICDVLFENTYTDSQDSGFIFSKRTNTFLKAKYVEKSIKKVVITDPFGEEIESLETTYYTCQFELNKDQNLIAITNPPRTLRNFIVKMHALFGLGLVLAEIKADVSLWLEDLKNDFSKVKVRHIAACGISVPPSGLAKLSVSGKVDIQKEFNTVVGNHRYQTDVIKLDCIYHNTEYQIEIHKSAAIKIKGNYNSEIIAVCSRYLSESI